ncbi:MAG: NAD(+)/NADH kinase [Termitinemataceae bacterium]|nr:MAG: NAD(+)/NADH kinase [Termitinemataceae bacterium]
MAVKVLLILNPQKAASQKLATEIKAVLVQRGIDVDFLSYTDKATKEYHYDIAFSLGGDGTVLFAARSVAKFGVPILPLNLGTLGFIASVHPLAWETVFKLWQDNKHEISPRIMLDINVERGGKHVFNLAAFNDAVISASGIAKTIRLEAANNNMNLGSYRSDGLIVSTPTGSTAYCASAGGPILDPEMEAIILNPICPFTLLYRPLVLPASETLTVKVVPDQRSGVLLTVDGQVTEALEPKDLIHISKTSYKAMLLGSDRNAFYKALHTKLAMLGEKQGGGG